MRERRERSEVGSREVRRVKRARKIEWRGWEEDEEAGVEEGADGEEAPVGRDGSDREGCPTQERKGKGLKEREGRKRGNEPKDGSALSFALRLRNRYSGMNHTQIPVDQPIQRADSQRTRSSAIHDMFSQAPVRLTKEAGHIHERRCAVRLHRLRMARPRIRTSSPLAPTSSTAVQPGLGRLVGEVPEPDKVVRQHEPARREERRSGERDDRPRL